DCSPAGPAPDRVRGARRCPAIHGFAMMVESRRRWPRQKSKVEPIPCDVSPIRRVERDVLGDLALPAVAVGKQTLLVVVEFLACRGSEFEIRSLDDRIDRAGLLTQAAIDALHHVDVVARGAARPVVSPRASLDGDRLCRADRLAQLAGDTALFAVGIAPQRMLA